MTNSPVALQNFEEILLHGADRFQWRDSNRLDAFIPTENLLPAIEVVMGSGWRYLAAITGLDVPAADDSTEEGQIEVLYHFCEGASILTLRVAVPYSAAVIPSVCGVLPYATLYERELIELLGLTITSTPSTARLLLPDDWPVGVYPLRKSFTGLEKGQ